MSKKRQILPFFLVQKGCPYACSYCKQEDISGKEACTPSDVQKALENDGSYDEVALYGGSFTCLPKEERFAFYEAIRPSIDAGKVNGIRISTRPDAINESIVEELVKNHVKAVELGVQSMDDEVLITNGRGHTKEDVRTAVNLLKTAPISIGLQMMTGLPRDTDELAIRTAKSLICLQPDFVRIYPVLVFGGTALARWYREGKYIPPTLEASVQLCAKLVMLFYQANIPIIRLGLHEEESMHEEGAYVAGPIHPAFGDLVEDTIFHKYFSRLLQSCEGQVTIRGPYDMIQHIAGHKGWVRKELEKGKCRIKLIQEQSETSTIDGSIQAVIHRDEIYREGDVNAFKSN